MSEEWSFDGLCRLAAAVYVGLDEAEKREWRAMGKRLMDRIRGIDEPESRRKASRIGYMAPLIEDGRGGRRMPKRGAQ